MNTEQDLHMMEGCGEYSYANNSKVQEKAIFETKPLLEKAIEEICNTLHPSKIMIADLGCSSGPNTLLVLSMILNLVDEHCRHLKQSRPEIQYFLNDLPSNDFNNIFQLLAPYKKQMKRDKGEEFVPFYVVGLPGSFYGRLFPSNSIHLFHSSYCLMWLSQVPRGLEGHDCVQFNKGNMYLNEESSSIEASFYFEQFKRDFSVFLNSRSKELIFGGRMILSFLGSTNPPSIGGHVYFLGYLSEALNTMVSEGLVDMGKLNSFKLPFYAPLMEEVRSVIETEGSFQLTEDKHFESSWDPFDESTDNFVLNKDKSGENVAKYTRAVFEPLLASHFGNEIMNELFSRFAKNIARHMSQGKPMFTVLIFFLKLKDDLTKKN